MTKKRFPIYNRYLKIKTKKPKTIILACIMPFLQSFLGAILQVLIIKNNISLIGFGAFFYWSLFALNGKRIALGQWKAILTFITFATIGTMVGVWVTNLMLNEF